jgi:hypothetical protein
MGRGVKISCIGGENTMGRGFDIPWLGGENTMYRGIQIDTGLTYHGGQNTI